MNCNNRIFKIETTAFCKIKFILINILFLVLFSTDNVAKTAIHSGTKGIRTILLVVALDKEAAPIITELKLHQSTQQFDGLPMTGYEGRYADFNIFLIKNGTDPVYQVQNIGKEPATLATYLGISYFHPDLIINVGTAGGISQHGAQMGDVYLSQKILFIDRRMPNSGYARYGVGDYNSYDTQIIAQNLSLKQGVICSGDSFDANNTDYKRSIKYHCAARDMEAAAVAWVSELTKTPMFAMKGITDVIGSKHTKEQFDKSVDNVSQHIAQELKRILNYLNTTPKNKNSEYFRVQPRHFLQELEKKFY